MARSRVVDVIWFLILAGGSSAYCVTAAAELGATFDEPFYVATGLESWRTGSPGVLMAKGTMPLPIDVQTLPLYLWELRRGERFDNPYLVMHELLPVARAMNLPFWWLLLFYGMRWGRLLGGPWAGRLAGGMLAAEPNLLAHAMLATTDIALTATLLIAAFHWYTGRDRGWRGRVLVPGVLYGVALAAKASAFAFVPIVWLVLGLCHLYYAQPFAWRSAWHTTSRLRWDLFYSLWIGFVLVFAYVGCKWENEPTFVAWAQQLPDGTLKSVILPVSENLPIFSNAGEGLVQQIKHNFRGHGSYILGEYHKRAVWYYFPVALSIKLPEGVLLLGLFLLGTRPRALLTPAGWVALALLLFSLNARVQIGVRLVFPLVAFLQIALAVAVARPPATPARPRFDDLVRWILAGLTVVSMAVTSALLWPDPLRHVNRLWGGPTHGPALLEDSNYDWGQGLPELKAWWSARGEPRLHVWYFGADPAVFLPPFQLIEVHRMPDATEKAVADTIRDGYFAVSLALLESCPERNPNTLDVVQWLRTLEPVGRTRTFVIFKAP